MKRICVLLLAVLILLSLSSCLKTKTLHCDSCNKEISVKESSNMEEDWTIYCKECEEELFGDNLLLGKN